MHEYVINHETTNPCYNIRNDIHEVDIYVV